MLVIVAGCKSAAGRLVLDTFKTEENISEGEVFRRLLVQ
jgi:hypothetical protein